MKFTYRYIMARRSQLTKQQCEFVVKNLKFIPKSLEMHTAHVPYVLGYQENDEDDDYSEYAPYPYEQNEDVVEYVARMADMMCVSSGEQINDLGWQWYRVTNVRRAGYKLPWDSPEGGWNKRDCHSYDFTEYKNQSTAIGMETATECMHDVIADSIIPLSVFDANVMNVTVPYAIEPVKDGIPCTSFVGKGIGAIEELWRELGGTILDFSSGDTFPWRHYVAQWTLPDDIADAFFDLARDVYEMSRRMWPEEFAQWIAPEPEEDDDEEEDDEDWDDEEDFCDEEETTTDSANDPS